MKKKYIAPQSKLFAINLNENIAVSGGISEVSGSATIMFTQNIDGCRGIYTSVPSAEVHVISGTFFDYYQEIQSYGAEVYFKCFKYTFG